MTSQLLAYTGTQFMKDLGWLVVAIVSIAGAFMTLYAVYIGFLFATATDANKRKAAKERLIKTIASALIVVGLAMVLAVIKVNFTTVEGGKYGEANFTSLNNFTYKEEFPRLQLTKTEISEDKVIDGVTETGYLDRHLQGGISFGGDDIKVDGVFLKDTGKNFYFTEVKVLPWYSREENNNDNNEYHVDGPKGTAKKTEYKVNISVKYNSMNGIRTAGTNGNGSYVTFVIYFEFDGKNYALSVDMYLSEDYLE